MSKEGQTTYLVTYDIVDDRRRSRAADVLLSYGYRIQASVYLVETHGSSFVRMKDQLGQEINMREDSIVFCDLGGPAAWKRRLQQIGKSFDTTAMESVVF